MPRNFVLSVLFFGIWLLWSGHFTPMLLGFGVLSVLFVMRISIHAGMLDEEGAPIQFTWKVLRYIPWLAKEILVTNLDVTKRILLGEKSINPQWMVVNGSQETDVGFVIYANSITLTPGTVTVDIQGRGLLVHAIADEPAKGLTEGEMNRRVALIEEIK